MKYGQFVVRNKDLTGFLKAPREEVRGGLKIYKKRIRSLSSSNIMEHRHIYHRGKRSYICIICNHYIIREK